VIQRIYQDRLMGEVAHDPREATGLRMMAEKRKDLFVQN
jgi:hypothetical protein